MSTSVINKDGTPAKKRGRKPKNKQVETPEGEYVTIATKEPPKPLNGGEWEKVKLAGPVEIETPEGNTLAKIDVPEAPQAVKKPAKPLVYSGFTVRSVQGEFGRYSFDPHTNPQGQQYLDYENEAGDELSMTVEQWREFRKELQKAARILGVEL